MEKFIIKGGSKIDGSTEVYSAKNSVLALLAASILTEEQVIIHKCPKISDVLNMQKILESLGCVVVWQNDAIIINSENATMHQIPTDIAKEIRSSIFMLGSILGRFKHAKVVFPGGCDIGIRPIDLHLKGLRALNIQVDEMGGFIECDAKNSRGNEVHLDFPSVGATENIILASVLSKGETLITNAAKEPEIVALQDFLNLMGAKISGAGTVTIRIAGVKKLHGLEFTPIPDRIVAGTYIIAAAITEGNLELKNVNPADLFALVSKLNGVACDIIVHKDSMQIKGYKTPLSVQMIETSPYPGFPTDLQPQILALQTVSQGTSVITENIFETRYKHVGELVKMGANIVVRDRVAIVRGVKKIFGADLYASDLRGGAGLVLAGLIAEGATTISNIKQIDRGYIKFEKVLASLGANIIRVDE